MSKDTRTVTAALLVIGDEILSGRTKDKNIGYIAEYLTGLGIDLREVRVVPDEMDEIVAAVQALRGRYRYLFTTGGIGPTHDDITADAIGAALGLPVTHDPRAVALLKARFDADQLNEARLRMARMPVGSVLIANPISKAPGFMIENVIVMAGVPSIMQLMLDDATQHLETGTKMLSHAITTQGLTEGNYAVALGELAARHPDVSIGSYPSFTSEGIRNQIVVRTRTDAALHAAVAEIEQMLAQLASAFTR